MKLAAILLTAIFCSALWAQSGSIKNSRYKEVAYKPLVQNKITYIPLQGTMRNPNSAWGSVGTAKEGFVYVMVCDHISDAEIFEYNVKTKKLYTLGTLRENLNLNSWIYRQPKVHSQVYQHAKNGLIYFGGDAGDASEGAVFDHSDEGYWGGFLCSLNPVTKEVKNLGMPFRHAGVKSIWVDSDNDRVYINSSNGTRFIIYDIKTEKFDDLGRVNGNDCPRTLFTDKWNNIYNVTEAGTLLRYSKSKDALEYLASKIPFCMGPSQVAYGPNRDYLYMVVNYTAGDVYRFTPSKDGAGQFDSLGLLFTGKFAVRNMNFANNKIYAVATGQELPDNGSGGKDTLAVGDLVVFDPAKKAVEKKIRMIPDISACYGAPNLAGDGNCYIAGWTDVAITKKEEKKHNVYLIQFNPKSL